MKDALHQEIAKLRGQLADAEGTIADLRKVLKEGINGLRGVAGMTPAESKMIAALAKRGRMSSDQLGVAVQRKNANPPDRRTIQVQIHNARAKLRPFGVTIDTIRDFGYEITKDNAARLNALAARRLAGLPVIASPSLCPDRAAA